MEWTAARFLSALVAPRRHRDPRVADALQGSAPVFVAAGGDGSPRGGVVRVRREAARFLAEE